MDPALGQRIENALRELDNIPWINSGGCGLVAWAMGRAFQQLGYVAGIRTVDGGWGMPISPDEVRSACGVDTIHGMTLPEMQDYDASFYHCLCGVVIDGVEYLMDTQVGVREGDDSEDWACQGRVTEGAYEVDEFEAAATTRYGWNSLFKHGTYKRDILEIINRNLGVTVTLPGDEHE